MNDQFLVEIRAKLDLLSKSELKVGNWVLKNTGVAVSASVQQVARESGVSEPTVIRFCRSMGLEGFRDLKTNLIASLHKRESYLHHDVDNSDSASDAAVKVLESSVQSLIDLRKQMFAMPFDAAVTSLVAARQIVFIGLGASGHVASDACHKFFRLGVPCTTTLDSQTILQQAAVCQPEDVLIVISHTGTWDLLIEGMRIAIERGVTVIAVTDPKSPLAEVATFIFPCHPPEDTNVFTPMSSRLAQLTVLDALQVSMALAMGSSAEENLKLAKSALNTRRQTGLVN